MKNSRESPDIDDFELDGIIDPDKTNLSNLLTMAENMSKGILALRGEMPDGHLQWGTVIIYGDRAESIMKKIQDILNDELTEMMIYANENKPGELN